MPKTVSILWNEYRFLAEAFSDGYRALLARKRECLDAAIVICEPFLLPVCPDGEAWRSLVDGICLLERASVTTRGRKNLRRDDLFAMI